jgi:hypothetical protein
VEHVSVLAGFGGDRQLETAFFHHRSLFGCPLVFVCWFRFADEGKGNKLVCFAQLVSMRGFSLLRLRTILCLTITYSGISISDRWRMDLYGVHESREESGNRGRT